MLSCILTVYFVYLDRLVLPVQTNESAFHLVQNRRSRPDKRPLDVLLTLRRSLYVKHFVVPSELERLLSRDHSLRHHITFVADQHHDDILVAVILDVFDPSGNIAEGLFASEVKNYKCGCRGAVVGASDGFELFLSGSIPDLQFDDFVVDEYVLAGEFYADSVLMVGIEFILYKATNNASFSDGYIPHEDKLERIVESGRNTHERSTDIIKQITTLCPICIKLIYYWLYP